MELFRTQSRAAVAIIAVSLPVLTLHFMTPEYARITPEISRYFDTVTPLLGLTFLFLIYGLKTQSRPLIRSWTRTRQALYLIASILCHALCILVFYELIFWTDPDFLNGPFLLNSKSVSPDGTQVAYIARGGLGSHCDLYLKASGGWFVSDAGRLDTPQRCQESDGLKIVWGDPSGSFRVMTPEGMEIPKNEGREGWFGQRLGQEVVLEGTALDEKLGAILSTGHGVIWIDGLDAWPQGFYLGGDKGRRLRVRGVVISRNDLPVFEENPGDPVRSGIPVPPGTNLRKASQRYLLSRASWEIVK